MLRCLHLPFFLIEAGREAGFVSIRRVLVDRWCGGYPVEFLVKGTQFLLGLLNRAMQDRFVVLSNGGPEIGLAPAIAGARFDILSDSFSFGFSKGRIGYYGNCPAINQVRAPRANFYTLNL